MGYYFTAQLPDGQLRYAHVGTNGSQDVMLGLWLAGYAVAGRPESRRVRGRWYDVVPGAPEPVWYGQETVSGVRKLIACTADDCAWVIVSRHCDATITRGLKLKPVTDPPLRALVELWRIDRDDAAGRALSPELTAHLAETFTMLLPHLQPSAWHPTLTQVAGVFTAAAAAGVGVYAG
jgi:hypothetical protein